MVDQDRERWTKLVADFETSGLTQREFASERGIGHVASSGMVYSGSGAVSSICLRGSRDRCRRGSAVETWAGRFGMEGVEEDTDDLKDERRVKLGKESRAGGRSGREGAPDGR